MRCPACSTQHPVASRALPDRPLCATQGVDPMYVWVPLAAPAGIMPWAQRRAGAQFMEEDTGVPELQVHCRLQWVRAVERGQVAHLDVALAGLGFSVVGCACLGCAVCRVPGHMPTLSEHASMLMHQAPTQPGCLSTCRRWRPQGPAG